jgi:hypothetical protein
MGALGAALLVAYALSIPFWGDIVGRLGPSEANVLAGLPLFLAGASIAVGSRSSRTLDQIPSAALLAMGGLICVGSKEYMLILTLPTLYLLHASARRRPGLVSTSAILFLIVAAIVASSLLVATAGSGMDVYGRSVTLLGRMRRFAGSLLERHLLSPFTMLVALTGGIGMLLLVPGITSAKRAEVIKARAWPSVFVLST